MRGVSCPQPMSLVQGRRRHRFGPACVHRRRQAVTVVLLLWEAGSGMGRAAEAQEPLPVTSAAVSPACPAGESATNATIFGVLRDAGGSGIAGSPVAAWWLEVEVGLDSARTRYRTSVDTTTSAGAFRLCGLPRSTDVAFRAGEGDVRTGQLTVAIGEEPVITIEVVAGPSAPSAVATGRLLSKSGAPIPGEIAVLGENHLLARTDSLGRFQLANVPRRSHQIVIRSIGFAPRAMAIAPDGPLVEFGDIVMDEALALMPDMNIRARRARAREEEFNYRRRVLRGHFFDEEELSRYPRVHAGVLAGRAPSLRAQPGGLLRIDRGFRSCTPRYWIDGAPHGRAITGDLLADALRRAKRIEIYVAQQAPAEFTDFDGCGAVVIWTE